MLSFPLTQYKRQKKTQLGEECSHDLHRSRCCEGDRGRLSEITKRSIRAKTDSVELQSAEAYMFSIGVEVCKAPSMCSRSVFVQPLTKELLVAPKLMPADIWRLLDANNAYCHQHPNTEQMAAMTWERQHPGHLAFSLVALPTHKRLLGGQGVSSIGSLVMSRRRKVRWTRASKLLAWAIARPVT